MIRTRHFFQRSFHNLTTSRRAIWHLVRWLVPMPDRWYFEGCRPVPGQLWYAERKLIYETVRSRRPEHVFEVGTWQGGGSTLFVSQALHDSGFGRLHTVEVDPEQHARAIHNYRRHLQHLLPYVTFHLGQSTDVFPAVLADLGRVDMMLLDGLGEEQSLHELELFMPYVVPSTILLAHDWFTEKMARVRPVVEQDAGWDRLHLLEPPKSVGLAVYCRKPA